MAKAKGIGQFTRQNLQTLRAEIDAALATVATRNGIRINFGNIRFSGTEARGPLTMTVVEGSEAAGVVSKKDQLAQDFTDYANAFGMKPEWLGKTIRFGGRDLKIVGLNRNAWKRPVLVEGTQGGRYIIDAVSVVQQLGGRH